MWMGLCIINDNSIFQQLTQNVESMSLERFLSVLCCAVLCFDVVKYTVVEVDVFIHLGKVTTKVTTEVTWLPAL